MHILVVMTNSEGRGNGSYTNHDNELIFAGVTEETDEYEPPPSSTNSCCNRVHSHHHSPCYQSTPTWLEA